jgi:hypothetical protein
MITGGPDRLWLRSARRPHSAARPGPAARLSSVAGLSRSAAGPCPAGLAPAGDARCR